VQVTEVDLIKSGTGPVDAELDRVDLDTCSLGGGDQGSGGLSASSEPRRRGYGAATGKGRIRGQYQSSYST